MQIDKLIGKKSYERIEYTLRRHMLTFVPTLLFFIVLLLIPAVLGPVLVSIFPTLSTAPAHYASMVILTTVYYLSTLLFFYTHFVDYYLDLWIVTNDRIIDIEQQGIFSRTITELDLHQVQDVTTEIHGVFPTLFHFGDVKVKTASMNLDIIFRSISRPDRIRSEILRLADEDRRLHLHAPPSNLATKI